MKTIEFKSNFGRFAYRMTARIEPNVFMDGTETNPPEALSPHVKVMMDSILWLLTEQGLANICYRTVGSNVDKKLGIKSKKNGGNGRNAVLYSVEDGERINAAVSEKITEMEKDEKLGAFIRPLHLSFAVTGEHEFGVGAEPTKEDEEFWTSVQAMPADQFANALKALGLDEDYDDDKALLACRELRLKAEREAKAAAKSGLLGRLGVK